MVRIRVSVTFVSQACGIAVPAPQRHRHATHVIYMTLTIKLGPARLCDVHTRVRAVIQVCDIAVPAPKRPHAGDTREVTRPTGLGLLKG